MPHKITVRTNGQTLTVNASVSHWTSEALALAASGTNDVESTTTTTITSDYDLWFANTATTAVITVKQLDGTTLLSQTFPVTPGHGNRTLNPAPTALQAAADAARMIELAYAPTGAIAETFSRRATASTSSNTLVSGRLQMAGVVLTAGQIVTNISVLSGTTAAGTPTNQWFALYDSSRVLLGATDDDTSTAWAGNTVKTLALSAPHTVTYTGLHYLGVMVAASTAPSNIVAAPGAVAAGLVPILCGASTTGLTDTPPDPAGAITAGAALLYAYVS